MPKWYEPLCREEVLKAGWEKVEENDGAAGIDGFSLEHYQERETEFLAELALELKEFRYSASPLKICGIPKKHGGTRYLSIPTIKDRIVQSALTILLTPLMENEFEDCSFGYRPGRSIYDAMVRIQRLREEGYKWVVDADVEHFFDEVDHTLLMERLTPYLDDELALSLIHSWLKAERLMGVIRLPADKGLPQGLPISPILANFYLDKFDEALLASHRKLVRYADDFVILCRDRPRAEETLDLTESLLKGLHLQLNREKTQITDFNAGFEFLGALFVKSIMIPPQVRAPEPAEGSNTDNIQFSKTKDSLLKIVLAPSTADPVNTTEINTAEATLPSQEISTLPKPEIPFDIPAEEAVEINSPQPLATPPIAAQSHPEEDPPYPVSPFLRTLYIQEQGSILRKSNSRFLVYKDEQILADLPAFKIQQIMVLGHCAITLPALVYCLEKAIPITYLSGTGKYYGRTSPVERSNLELLQAQLTLSQDTGFRLAVSRQIVLGKLQNTRELLRRVNRYREHPALSKAREDINHLLEKVPATETLDSLRGLEGAGAAAYFSALEEILPPHWKFHGRKRQPPPDPFNSLLSFGYTILFYNLYSLAEMRGLHTAAGFLHDRRSGHPALVSDLMEEWRAPIVDALAIKMALNSELSPADDFQLPSSPGLPCLLGESARKKWLDGLEKKFHTLISHPLFEEQVNLRRAAQIQVERLAWCLLKKQPDYEPYLWR